MTKTDFVIIAAMLLYVFLQRLEIQRLKAKNSMLYRDNVRMIEDSHSK